MIDNHSSIKTALETVLPTYHEMIVNSGVKIPCISYMELSNIAEEKGDTLEYSRITYQIKVWGNRLEDIQRYSMAIDAVLRPMGYKRINSGELHDNKTTLIQKVITYEALTEERF